jgi:methionine-rich copper-binding protein CopC
MPKLIDKPAVFAATLAFGILAAAPMLANAVTMHFALSSSLPEADATVQEVGVIQLTFTEAPEEEGRLIRLANPQGDQVRLGEIQMDAETVMSARVEAQDLGNGTYTVSWRGAGDDGHFVTGEYKFTLQATEAGR